VGGAGHSAGHARRLEHAERLLEGALLLADREIKLVASELVASGADGGQVGSSAGLGGDRPQFTMELLEATRRSAHSTSTSPSAIAWPVIAPTTGNGSPSTPSAIALMPSTIWRCSSSGP
jgi:hypothetical protein